MRVGSAGGAAAGRVALDVEIVCPQAAVHLANAQESLGAAEAYTRTKCDRAQMAERCRVAGVVFQPMIFESLGGVSVEAEGVIKVLIGWLQKIKTPHMGKSQPGSGSVCP